MVQSTTYLCNASEPGLYSPQHNEQQHIWWVTMQTIQQNWVKT